MPQTGYSNIATATITGVNSYTISGLAGYDYRFVLTGNPGGAVGMRVNGNTESSRYTQLDWRVVSGSTQNFTWRQNSFNYIYLFDYGQNINGFTSTIIDTMNPTATSASPPRPHQGWARSFSANSASTGSYSYLTGWQWYNSDVAATSFTFFRTDGGNFSTNTVLSAFEIGPL